MAKCPGLVELFHVTDLCSGDQLGCSQEWQYFFLSLNCNCNVLYFCNFCIDFVTCLRPGTMVLRDSVAFVISVLIGLVFFACLISSFFSYEFCPVFLIGDEV